MTSKTWHPCRTRACTARVYARDGVCQDCRRAAQVAEMEKREAQARRGTVGCERHRDRVLAEADILIAQVRAEMEGCP